GFIMMRFRVEQRAVDHANERMRLLATACEQSTELIVLARGRAIEYANEAFCRATGYSREELAAIMPAQLVATESIPATVPVLERLSRREAVRVTLTVARKDGTTFQAACAAAPRVAPDGTATHVVAVGRDLTAEVRRRESRRDAADRDAPDDACRTGGRRRRPADSRSHRPTRPHRRPDVRCRQRCGCRSLRQRVGRPRGGRAANFRAVRHHA